MKLLFWLAIACVALALLKVAVTIVVVAFAIFLLIAAIVCPRALSGYVGMWVLLHLLERHPFATLAAFLTLCLIDWIGWRGGAGKDSQPGSDHA